MAKLTAPLFSFGARGKLADSLVYFPWKGVDAVRSYVVPANPNTSAQQTQRGYMDSAVQEFHDSAYNAIDIAALNRWANVLAPIMSGFNAMVREFINEAILGNTWERLSQAVISAVLATGFTVTVSKATGGNAPQIRWGTSKTFFGTSAPMVDNLDGTWSYSITGLSAETLYYFTVDIGTSGTDWARLGIYSQRTTA